MATEKGKKTRAPRTSTVPKDESKTQKFVRLAQQRTGKALKMIDNLGKLSGPGYEYTPEQVGKILTALHGALENVKQRFSGTKKEAVQFKL